MQKSAGLIVPFVSSWKLAGEERGPTSIMAKKELRMSDCQKAKNSNIEEVNKVQKLQRSLYSSAKRNGKRRYHSLYDKFYRKDILWAAWVQVKSNRGSAGIDNVTIQSIIDSETEEEMIEEIHTQLVSETYQFSPVKEILIPKPKGGHRPLGIATIRDRVVQTAMKIVLEPIFEADFHDCSYGYRPKRGAWRAVAKIKDDLYQRAWGVLEVDIKSYFTQIDHGKLQKLIEKRICDGRALSMIKQTLKVPVHRGKQTEKTTRGVPQGSPLSPLYSNIYLNVLDQLWHRFKCPEKLGARLHRYADDLIIVCSGSATPVKRKLVV